ncbi:MAG TPA: hypothetical protein VGM75_02205, partial [Pseudonocardiaceae bacterium]
MRVLSNTTVDGRQRAQPVEPALDTADEPEPARRFSLSIRVTLLAAICVAVAVALVSLGAYLTVRQNLYSQAQANLLDEAAHAASGAVYRPCGFEVSLPSNNSFNNVRISIIDSSGTQLPLCAMNDGTHFTYSVPSALIGDHEKEVAASSVNPLAPNSSLEDVQTQNGYVVVSVALPVGQGYALVAAQPLTAETSILDRLSLVLFLISGAGIVVAALAGTAVATGGLRPVARLTAATERVATGDLRPIPVTG